MPRPRFPRRWSAAAGVVALVALAPVTQTVGASFVDAASLDDPQQVSSASLAPVDGLDAVRTAADAEVSWHEPSVRSDVEADYTIERTLDGATTTLAASVTTVGGAASFTDDLTVPTTDTRRTWVQVSRADDHACALSDAGEVFCWGHAGSGRLGHPGLSYYRTAPHQAGVTGDMEGVKIASIDAGSTHTCALSVDGDVYCWGSNSDGRIGDGSQSVATVPKRVAGALDGVKVSQVSAGGASTCALTVSGQVYCWGSNTEGQLGTGGYTASPTPVMIAAAAFGGAAVARVDAGLRTTCAVAVGGRAYCWGSNGMGQVMDGSLTGNPANHRRPVPTPVVSPLGTTNALVAKAVATTNHGCLLTTAGQVYCTKGVPTAGGAGDYSIPAPLVSGGEMDGVVVTDIDASLNRSCALTEDGRVFCWGAGAYGALGNGSTASQQVPVRAGTSGDMQGVTTAVLSTGYHGACAVGEDHEVFCWGSGLNNVQLTDLTTDDTVPVRLPLPQLSTCDAGWVLAGDACQPGPSLPIVYTVSYTKAGWTPSGTPATTTATSGVTR